MWMLWMPIVKSMHNSPMDLPAYDDECLTGDILNIDSGKDHSEDSVSESKQKIGEYKTFKIDFKKTIRKSDLIADRRHNRRRKDNVEQ